MKLDDRTKILIAVGASVACNCHPCLEYHLGQALSMGIEATLIEEAIDAGKAVRSGAASSMDRLAHASRLHRARAHLRKALEKACVFYRSEDNELACDRKGPFPIISEQ